MSGSLSGVRLRAFARVASYGDASAKRSGGSRFLAGFKSRGGGPPSLGPPVAGGALARASARQASHVGDSPA
jgi:hypothetical protein